MSNGHKLLNGQNKVYIGEHESFSLDGYHSISYKFNFDSMSTSVFTSACAIGYAATLNNMCIRDCFETDPMH